MSVRDCATLPHLTSPMSLVVRRTCKVEVVFVLRLHHSWLSVGPAALLSAIDLSWSPVHASGTTYRSTSLLLPRCKSSKTVLRLTCLRHPSLNYFVQCHRGGLCHYCHLNRSSYIYIYIFVIRDFATAYDSCTGSISLHYCAIRFTRSLILS